MKVIKKVRKMSCGRCHKTANGITGKRKGCPNCKGKGNYEDYHYYHIVTDKNGNQFCYDGDTIK